MHHFNLLSDDFWYNIGKLEEKFLLGAKRQAFNKPILLAGNLTKPSGAHSVEWYGR
jgi:hypothetical protein